jgi:hypothetical protein
MKTPATAAKTAKLLSWSVAAILVLLPFHALLTTWIGSHTAHFDLIRIWKEILLALMIPPAIWLALRSPDLRRWFIRSPILNLFRLYVLLHIVLGLWAYHQHRVTASALVYALIINLRFLFFFVVCYIAAANYDWLKRNWQLILLAPAALVIFFGLLQKFLLPHDFLKHFGYSPETIPAYQTVDSNLDFRRIQSTLRGANPLGSYLVLAVPALYVSLKRRIWLRMVAIVSALIVLFYSYSRSAWIGTLIAIGLIVWWQFNRSRRMQRAGLILATLAVFVGGSLFLIRYSTTAQDTLFHTSSNSTSVWSSNQQRAEAIKRGFNDVVHEPLGRGPGTAGPASYRNPGYSARIAENYFLQIGQEVGILGMALFIAINFLVAAKLWVRRQDPLALILLVSLIGLTFGNLISHVWTDDTIAYLWWGLAGIALAPYFKKS